MECGKIIIPTLKVEIWNVKFEVGNFHIRDVYKQRSLTVLHQLPRGPSKDKKSSKVKKSSKAKKSIKDKKSSTAKKSSQAKKFIKLNLKVEI